MKKFKKIITAALSLLVISSMTGCKDNNKIETETLSYDQKNFGYKIEVNVPKEKGYEIISGISKEGTYHDNNASYSIVGDKVRIEFRNSSYVFQTGTDYVKANGKVEPSFAKFKEYVQNGGTSNQNDEFVTINGRETYKYDRRHGAGTGELKGYVYNFDMDDITTKISVNASIFPVDETQDISQLINDEEVQTILNSIKFEKAE